MMRFEVAAAYAMGVILPLLETLRRGADLSHFAFYVDDFIAGALLLYAARSVSRGKPGGPVLLVMAWSVLAGGLYGSFFGQLYSTGAQDIGGLPNLAVVIIKGLLYAIALTGLWLSVRSAVAGRNAGA